MPAAIRAATYVAQVLAAWASRYLDPEPRQDAAAQGVRVVTKEAPL